MYFFIISMPSLNVFSCHSNPFYKCSSLPSIICMIYFFLFTFCHIYTFLFYPSPCYRFSLLLQKVGKSYFLFLERAKVAFSVIATDTSNVFGGITPFQLLRYETHPNLVSKTLDFENQLSLVFSLPSFFGSENYPILAVSLPSTFTLNKVTNHSGFFRNKPLVDSYLLYKQILFP